MTTAGVQFSDDGIDVLKREVNFSDATPLSDYLQSLKEDEKFCSFSDFYEIYRCVTEVLHRKSQRVALQFPDFMLGDSFEVVSLLQKEYASASTSPSVSSAGGNQNHQKLGMEFKVIDPLLKGTPLFFVLGDTSYSNCCVDEVAAAHLNADLIIHYGPACMSPINKIPAIYVFGKAPLMQRHVVWNIGTCLKAFYQRKQSNLDTSMEKEGKQNKEEEERRKRNKEDKVELKVDSTDKITNERENSNNENIQEEKEEILEQNIVVLYDLCYHHVIKTMETDFSNIVSNLNSTLVSRKCKPKYRKTIKVKLAIGQIPSGSSDMYFSEQKEVEDINVINFKEEPSEDEKKDKMKVIPENKNQNENEMPIGDKNTNVCKDENADSKMITADSNTNQEYGASLLLGGLEIDLTGLAVEKNLRGSDLDNTTVIYLGNSQTNQLLTLLFRLHPSSFLIYDPTIQDVDENEANTMKISNKRKDNIVVPKGKTLSSSKRASMTLSSATLSNSSLIQTQFSRCYWLNNEEMNQNKKMEENAVDGNIYTDTDANIYDTCITSVRPKEAKDIQRILKRRFYLIQKAKDAEVIGLVIGALGASRYSHMIQNLRQMIESRGKKAYIFSIGRLSVAKLANFGAIEVFCFLSCPEGALVIQKDDRDYMTPVITPLELEFALGESEYSYLGLGGDRIYSLDYRDLESIKFMDSEAKATVNKKRIISKEEIAEEEEGEEDDDDDEEEDSENEAPYYSLITGQFKSKSKTREGKDVIQLSYENNESNSDSTDLITSTSSRELSTFSSAAAKYLHSLDFQGLVIREDKASTEYHDDYPNNDDTKQDHDTMSKRISSQESKSKGAKLEEGTLGIASSYESL